jgi:hypothetical protein
MTSGVLKISIEHTATHSLHHVSVNLIVSEFPFVTVNQADGLLEFSLSPWADAIERERERERLDRQSRRFRFGKFIPLTRRGKINESTKHKPSDCFRVIFMGLFMYEDGYSIPSFHSCIEISHQAI